MGRIVIPGPWVSLILGLGAFRLLRLVSYDSFPPIARARAWVLGEYVVSTGSQAQLMGLTSNRPELEYRYRRPLLAELVHCSYCFGFWIALGGYLAWLEWPTGVLYGAAPFALSAFIGLVARNLDP